MGTLNKVREVLCRARGAGLAALQALWARMRVKASCARGQGTTEYAILVGVLVVIAIIAITLFRPKLQELWDAIANGINGL
ncbi:hypothetical protein VJ918_07595 [Adlercreutzia sp. R21]|uniref:Class III signal peptide-containing protein n=1 Tax=Adlercreutzia wanghongyangiae TaxID=3111451 RepID=A0ABU6IJU7_9ACTN|nr:hypothetical protein [Adlercreutzia sp. R21]MEC4176745.1 hypothetical protein [Adlercreutzia sp. R7]MEC4184669.1 hypothetical protein [Adlercreutzia sp. R21]